MGCFEGENPSSGDDDGFLGVWVAAYTSSLVMNIEVAKSTQFDGFTGFEVVYHCVKDVPHQSVQFDFIVSKVPLKEAVYQSCFA